jgi:exodeoxyribonuclease VII large subunit
MAQTELSFRPASSDRGGPRALTVGQLVRAAHAALDARFGQVWVEGEVSNLKLGSNGHAYFTLKDDEAALPVAMWRSAVERLRFRLADGQCLRVCGRVGIFAKLGRFQLYADRAEPAGLGALMLELEQRKARLREAGLFDPARKRPLPRWPRTVGVVTSPHGAVIHDIVRVARRRARCRILLAPAIVQGPEAPLSLVRALERIVRQGGVDVVIVGRGGGSVEDLWAFNDERLARAVAACPVPVVSAVGHDLDVTICDLVADVRAATPSQAAELAVPDLRAIEASFAALRQRLGRALERVVLDARSRLDAARARLGDRLRRIAASRRVRLERVRERLAATHPRARLARDRRRLDLLVRRLDAHARALPRSAHARLGRAVARLDAIGRALPRTARIRLARAAGKLDALSPLGVLERGYAVVSHAGAVLCDAGQVEPGAELDVRLHRGQLRARVTHIVPARVRADEEG